MLKTLRYAIVTAFGGMVTNVFAASALPNEVAVQAAQQQQEQLIRDQQRQQQFQQQMQPSVDVRLDGSDVKSVAPRLPQNETPCFAIQDIALTGDAAEQFQFALHQAIEQSGFTPNLCLGALGVNHIMTLVQNNVIERGYITTRILAAPQNLSDGHLVLNVFPGRIHQIRYNLDNQGNTHVERIVVFSNKFPASSGDILNLRELEQGLENLKRVPTAEADIQIVPADTPNESDVVVSWAQSRPFRFSVGVDDSGSHSTGKYQGNITLSLDNIMGLSDLFYVSLNKDLGDKDRLKDSDGKAMDSRTNGYSIHYSVPFGNWLWAVNHNYYRYHQAVAGLNENYDYNGDSSNTDIGVTRLLYRDAYRKTHITVKLWRRESRNYINDAEIDIQHRRTAGWAVGLDHKEYIKNATLSLALNYKRGTGADNSMRAPEEISGTGTSRMQVLTTDVGLNVPFSVGHQSFNYDGNLHAQWNHTPLIPQDRLSIGGRYTIRGFDGETTLMGERGWYLRDDLGWQYWSGHQLYMGVDVGHVIAQSTDTLLGHTLAGAVLGLKGQIMVGGQLYYDLFVGTPLYKPDYFKTPHTTAGFSLNYSF